MLDIRFVRENAERVKEASRQKGYEVDVDRVLELDGRRRELQQQADDLREKRNEIAGRMKGGKPTPELIEEGKDIKLQLAKLEADLGLTSQEYLKELSKIPNITQEGVPVGGEEDSAEVSKWGTQETGAKDHLDFALARDWVDFERGAKVAGAKFYYLKGDLALLENAITQFAVDFVTKQGFTLMSVPHMVNAKTAVGTGFTPRSDEQSDEYHIEGEDLSLIATAEIPLTGFHAGEIIDEDELPLLYTALSPCYRKEAGAYGKHTRGLFRVHQFNKLEMYAFVLPEKSQEMHEKILKIEEELWQQLEVPYRVVNIASGDLGAPAAKKYDIEYWSKADGEYREITSCSNCTDYQARNLNIRVRRKDGQIEMVHTLNGTAVSLARTLVAAIEHYQVEAGGLRIPEVLRPYLGARELL